MDWAVALRTASSVEMSRAPPRGQSEGALKFTRIVVGIGYAVVDRRVLRRGSASGRRGR